MILDPSSNVLGISSRGTPSITVASPARLCFHPRNWPTMMVTNVTASNISMKTCKPRRLRARSRSVGTSVWLGGGVQIVVTVLRARLVKWVAAVLVKRRMAVLVEWMTVVKILVERVMKLNGQRAKFVMDDRLPNSRRSEANPES